MSLEFKKNQWWACDYEMNQNIYIFVLVNIIWKKIKKKSKWFIINLNIFFCNKFSAKLTLDRVILLLCSSLLDKCVENTYF